MDRVVTGDTQALGVLFERHKQPLFRFLFRLLHERAPAEDLLLDVFLRVYDRRRTYRTGLKFSTWLYAIAHNLALDRLKHSSRRELPGSQLAEDPPSVDADPPYETLERTELAHAVREAVSALPEDQRVVILLREYEGLSYREIAAVVGAKEDAVRVRAHRARLALRELLRPFVAGEI